MGERYVSQMTVVQHYDFAGTLVVVEDCLAELYCVFPVTGTVRFVVALLITSLLSNEVVHMFYQTSYSTVE